VRYQLDPGEGFAIFADTTHSVWLAQVPFLVPGLHTVVVEVRTSGGLVYATKTFVSVVAVP
jgi:hypothetical protein